MKHQDIEQSRMLTCEEMVWQTLQQACVKISLMASQHRGHTEQISCQLKLSACLQDGQHSGEPDQSEDSDRRHSQ
jgi:hypothetical protein